VTFVQVFYHAFSLHHNVAHRDACERGVLHRDISFDNVMLSAGALANRQGLLIDFDSAIYQAANDTEPWSDDDNVYDDNDRDCAPACKEAETSVEDATDARQDD